MENFPWVVGKTYKTKGGLYAIIAEIRERAIPKELSSSDLEKLMKKPHYGIEGYVYLPGSMNSKIWTEWTLEGKHTLEENSSGTGDLTTEEVECQ